MYWQVQMTDQFGHLFVCLNQGIGKFDRMRSGVANTIYAIDGRDQSNQLCQVHHVAIVGIATVGVNVLA